MRMDSPALSGKGSHLSHHTLGGGWPHTETREEASLVVPLSERHRFPRPLKVSPDAGVPFQM